MHKCRTYFNISSDFEIDIEMISLQLSIDRKEISLSQNPNSINIGNCLEYDVDINNMLRKTLVSLLGKEEILVKLKEQYNFTYYLERVVELDTSCDEPTPILDLSSDIIAFLYKSETFDDLDYYLY